MDSLKRVDKTKIIIVLSFGFFIFMMIYNLTYSSLWGDEWVEYFYSQESIKTGDLYQKIIATFQPPMYNFLMHFWLLVNKSVLWFRGFNIVVGIMSAFFLYKALFKLCGRKVACSVLVALGMTYQWIYCVQEASEYALMLGFLFGAIWFYIELSHDYSHLKLLGFILFNVLALYSQYGAVFIAAPLLIIYYLQSIFDKYTDKNRKIILTLSYLVSLIAFALPLYTFFLKIQMKNNSIADNTAKMDAGILRDIAFTLGRILGWMFNLDNGDLWTTLYGIISIVLIAAAVSIVIKGTVCRTKKNLILVLLLGYVSHYLLVQMHVYAMVHPGQSGGFYCRYSYFYIPIFAVALPILFVEIKKIFNDSRDSFVVALSYVVCLISLLCSMVGVLENWNKTYDKEFAEIWMDNEGWKDITYLYGMASMGCNYYITHSKGYQDGYMNNMASDVDLENLPQSFWVWRTNWGSNAEKWQPTIDAALAQGYDVTVYLDEGDAGQLAYCRVN